MPLVAVESTSEANGRDAVQLPDDQFARVAGYGAVGGKAGNGGVGDGKLGLGGEGVA